MSSAMRSSSLPVEIGSADIADPPLNECAGTQVCSPTVLLLYQTPVENTIRKTAES